jgi:hypothetical protein
MNMVEPRYGNGARDPDSEEGENAQEKAKFLCSLVPEASATHFRNLSIIAGNNAASGTSRPRRRSRTGLVRRHRDQGSHYHGMAPPTEHPCPEEQLQSVKKDPKMTICLM